MTQLQLTEIQHCFLFILKGQRLKKKYDELICTVLVEIFFFQAEDGIRDDLATGVQTCALPISAPGPPASGRAGRPRRGLLPYRKHHQQHDERPADERDLAADRHELHLVETARDVVHELRRRQDRKSTRLNSSHQIISYAVFCLK